MSSSEIGYGKPPKATQFRKGTSGNPSGRKKGVASFKSLDRALRDSLLQQVRVLVDGKTQKMLRIDAILTVQYRAAMKGSTQAAKFLIGLAEKYVPKHQTLAELMEGRPVFEFTPEEARRIRKINILQEMQTADEGAARSEPQYLEPGEPEKEQDKYDPEPPARARPVDVGR